MFTWNPRDRGWELRDAQGKLLCYVAGYAVPDDPDHAAHFWRLVWRDLLEQRGILPGGRRA